MVAAIPKTLGLGLSNSSFGSTFGTTWGGGMGGNVLGVYLLLSLTVTSATLEDLRDVLTEYFTARAK